jgi:succinate dehydrogenase / fumarate reductase iron-sulfur subunit
MPNTKPVLIKIKRQLTPNAKPSWEEFEIPYKSNMNVTSALMGIAANPVTRDGKQTTPVTYDSNCLEEICGSCAMLISRSSSNRSRNFPWYATSPSIAACSSKI